MTGGSRQIVEVIIVENNFVYPGMAHLKIICSPGSLGALVRAQWGGPGELPTLVQGSRFPETSPILPSLAARVNYFPSPPPAQFPPGDAIIPITRMAIEGVAHGAFYRRAFSMFAG